EMRLSPMTRFATQPATNPTWGAKRGQKREGPLPARSESPFPSHRAEFRCKAARRRPLPRGLHLRGPSPSCCGSALDGQEPAIPRVQPLNHGPVNSAEFRAPRKGPWPRLVEQAEEERPEEQRVEVVGLRRGSLAEQPDRLRPEQFVVHFRVGAGPLASL